MSDGGLHVAVDLGAGSGRIFTGALGPSGLALDEIARFRYPPRHEDGHLRWDLTSILEDVAAGLRSAAARARASHRRITSIGIDSWGVDYGLVDRGGRVLEDPISYRDPRTEGMMARVFARVSRQEIFSRTGVQFLPINTLYQLAAHVDAGLPAGAARLLMIPDLVSAWLTGRHATELTNATTTQMVNARTQGWDFDLLERLGVPGALCPEILRAGETVGVVRDSLAGATGLAGTPVVAVATHDTGSAVAGTPLEDGWAYISSGTWSLVGVELDAPLLTGAAAGSNFTNEGGPFGTVRFLKNVTGLWILESCREEWARAGLDVSYHVLLDHAAAIEDPSPVIFPDAAQLLHPPSMLDALAGQLRDTGQPVPTSPAGMARVVLDSLAHRYASVIRDAERVTSRPIRGVRVVGGGSLNAYLNQATATTTGLPVAAGPVEATVGGNILVQAVASGECPSLALARRQAAAGLPGRVFLPRETPGWRQQAARYAEIEATLEG